MGVVSGFGERVRVDVNEKLKLLKKCKKEWGGGGGGLGSDRES